MRDINLWLIWFALLLCWTSLVGIRMSSEGIERAQWKQVYWAKQQAGACR